MLTDLARGLTEVASDEATLDSIAIAVLAEQGVGGVVSGNVIKIAVAVDRYAVPSRAALAVVSFGGSVQEITVDQAKAIAAQLPTMVNDEMQAKLGWLTVVTGPESAAGDASSPRTAEAKAAELCVVSGGSPILCS